MRKNVYRNPVYIVYIFFGIGLFLLSAEISNGGVGFLEQILFRLINNIGDWLYPVMLVFSIFGSIGIAWLASIVMLGFKRYAGALKLFLATTLAYLSAFLLKTLEFRQRPGEILTNVDVREVASMAGVPSGHSAVATAMAIILYQYVPAKFHGYITFIVLGTFVSRIYLGVHLPLDIIAGFGVGLAVASFISYLFGSHHDHKISVAIIKKKVQPLSLNLTKVDFLKADARGSVPYLAWDDLGNNYFIKVVSQDNYIADWLFKLYRRLIYRRLEDETPFFSPKRQIEHESYVAGLAHARGVNTPLVYGVFKIKEGSYGQVQQGISGVSLDKLNASKLSNEILEQTWLEVKKLHDSNIIHRDLRAANIVIDNNNKPWIIDFGFAEATVDETQLYRDIVELIASTALINGPKKAVSTAIKVEGLERVKIALPYMQYEAMSSATAKLLKQQPELFKQIRSQIKLLTGADNNTTYRIKRINFKYIFILVSLALGAYVLVPQISLFEQSLQAIKNAEISFIALSLVFSLLTYFVATMVYKTIAVVRIPLPRTLLIQFSSSFTNRLMPASTGGLATFARYLYIQGHSKAQAGALIVVNNLLGLLGLVITIFTVSAMTSTPITGIFNFKVSNITIISFLIISIVTVVLIGAVPGMRHKIIKNINKINKDIKVVAGRPARLLVALLWSILITILYAGTLFVVIHALGIQATFLQALIVMTIGLVSASITPTPGGLGGAEAGLTIALATIGIGPEIGLGIALAYRLVTYWIPIIPGFIAFNYAIKKQYI
jgi:uncharacterized protein (TIRG00374 family)